MFLRRVRTGDGGQRRLVESVREIVGVGETGLQTNEIWGYDRDGAVRRRPTVQIACENDLVDAGWNPHPVDGGWV